MIDSSSLSIVTPQKNFIRPVELTPIKLGKVNERFAPSSSGKKVLKQFQRVHQFQCHEPVEFKDLKDLNMDRNVAEEISVFLVSTDIPDTIYRLEEIAVENNRFHPCIKEYIAEEFDCDQEYSFAIIAVFHYMDKFKVTKVRMT